VRASRLPLRKSGQDARTTIYMQVISEQDARTTIYMQVISEQDARTTIYMRANTNIYMRANTNIYMRASKQDARTTMLRTTFDKFTHLGCSLIKEQLYFYTVIVVRASCSLPDVCSASILLASRCM
jgi:alpha-mannosidase